MITTNDDGDRLVNRCLTSVGRTAPDVAIVVVDNAPASPTTGSEERTRPVPHTVNFVENHGFGAAANAGVAHGAIADCDLIALLNDDVVVAPGWLSPLVAELEADPSVAAAQPKLLLADTDPPIVNSLGVEVDRYGAWSDRGVGQLDRSAPTTPMDVDAVTGGAVVVRRSCFEQLGGFDERLFLYYEDVDLSLRARERGWRLRCVPSSVVVHEVGATTSALGDERRFLQERNRLVVAARFADWRTVGRAVGLSVRRLRRAPRRAHARALLHGLARMPRAVVERFSARRTQ